MLEPINRLLYYCFRNNWMLDPRFYLGDFSNLALERPIFLLGNQGGGLTLISRMFRRHPKVVSVTGNYSYWAGADEMQNVFGPALPAPLTGIRHKAPLPNHPTLPPPRSWSYATDELLPWYRKCDSDATEQIEDRLKHILRYLLDRYLPRDQRPGRVIDKSQVFTLRVPLIDRLLRSHEPQFILITRNPYAACYRAAKGRAGDMERYKDHLSFEARLDLCTQHWFNSFRTALDDRSKIDSTMRVIQFEEMLNAPEPSLRGLCEFVNLDLRQDMLPDESHRMPLGCKYRDRWYPLRPDVNEKYLCEIPPKHVRTIREKCGELAAELGYNPPE